MKKSYLLLVLLVGTFLLAMTACSNEDEWKWTIKRGDLVYFQFTRTDVPYSPMNLSEMPSWLQDRVSNPIIGANRVTVYSGSLDGMDYYNMEPENWAASYYNPVFRDKEGNIIDKDQETSPIYRITNWVCIYYEEL